MFGNCNRLHPIEKNCISTAAGFFFKSSKKTNTKKNKYKEKHQKTNTKKMINTKNLNRTDTVIHDYCVNFDDDPMELDASEEDLAFVVSDEEPVGGIKIDYENPNMELQLALKNNDVVRHEREHLLFLAIADDVEHDHQMEVASLQERESHASNFAEKLAKKGKVNVNAILTKKKITKKIKTLQRGFLHDMKVEKKTTMTLRHRQSQLKEFIVLTQLDTLPTPKKTIGHVAVAVAVGV